MTKQVLLAASITIIAVIAFFSMPGCGVTGTSRQNDPDYAITSKQVKSLTEAANAQIEQLEILNKNMDRLVNSVDKLTSAVLLDRMLEEGK